MLANAYEARPGGPAWPPVLVPAGAYLGLAALSLVSCGAPLSPSIPLLGAYFPSWLICAAAGVLGAVLLRVIFVKIGLDELLPLRLLVYTCIAAIMGLVLALTLYGR
ncbi:YtcA family lipoprotein [Roseomonas xinghualingensis]|uniref:YtcA family lipoprotein n=1 Tax=Roseomonas xinghualingensis TaxID=2986475 RepID=UPI0021F148CE|nr:YtcA family lipoprotein [Roseomonas sp. SXEYE001]MCV4206346.1 YtcA family lipoprotein [Roseomonas sp. SXEYE001]